VSGRIREPRRRTSPRWLRPALTCAALIAGVTGVIALLDPKVPALGLFVLYLLAVVPAALLYGAVVAAAVSVVSVAAFDFLFLPPRFGFDPGTSERWSVLLAFLVSSLVVGQLAARSREEGRRSARLANEQAALRRVATLVARGTPPEEVFAAVVEEVGLLLEADLASMARYAPADALTYVAAWGSAAEHFPVGSRLLLGGHNLGTIVFLRGRSTRIDDFAESSTGAIGAAARYAGITSSVATPITVEGSLWGMIAAASTQKHPLPADTEARLAGFTELAATAISNAESRAALAQLADERGALGRVATLVAHGVRPVEIFSAVSVEVSRLFGTDYAAIGRFDADGPASVVVGLSREFPGVTIGTRWELDDSMALTAVYRTGRSARIDGTDWSTVSGPIGEAARHVGTVSTVACPIIVEGRLWGGATITAASLLPADTEERLAKFTELLATAIANADSRSELAASRRRIVAASDAARRRIERDLHDGTQQRLVSLVMAIRTVAGRLPGERDDLQAELSRIANGLTEAVEDLQELTRGIHPTILSQGGLGPALRALARRSAVPVEIDIATETRFPDAIEIVAYFVASEAMANAVKHAQASSIEVAVATRNGRLALAIRDDGCGGADPTRGSGLVGLTDRVEALGGSIDMRSPPGDGTQITVELPCELESVDGDDGPNIAASSVANAGRVSFTADPRAALETEDTE
jgi:signal transduction histidine kinase